MTDDYSSWFTLRQHAIDGDVFHDLATLAWNEEPAEFCYDTRF